MAGGSGTRFWPLSRKKLPKQFLNLTGKDIMVNETFDRLAKIASPEDIFVVTGSIYGKQTYDMMKPRVEKDHILEEPEARNTAACIGYAAMEIVQKYGDGIMCIMPSDHYIRREEVYVETVKLAARLAEKTDRLVTIGIEPVYPATGYGYIKSSSVTDEKGETAVYRNVEAFVEKPDADTARRYLAKGSYAWNSGMFVWKASVILEYYQKLLPDTYRYLEEIGRAMLTRDEERVIQELYPQMPKISIDYGIMEHADGVLMLEGSFGWNDVGSFDELVHCKEADENGNITIGSQVMIDTRNTVCYSKDRMIAAVGVENLIIIETEDAVMVCPKERAQDVRKLVEQLEEMQQTQYL